MPDKTNNRHVEYGTPNNTVLSMLLLQRIMVTILKKKKNIYNDDLRCAVAEENVLATVIEADEAFTVLYMRLEVTVFLNSPVQETVTVFI